MNILVDARLFLTWAICVALLSSKPLSFSLSLRCSLCFQIRYLAELGSIPALCSILTKPGHSKLWDCLSPLISLTLTPHSFTPTSPYSHIHACMRTYIRTYIHTCIHTSIHTYILKYIHTYMHTCIHTYIRACIHTYMQTCITYAQMYARALSKWLWREFNSFCAWQHRRWRLIL